MFPSIQILFKCISISIQIALDNSVHNLVELTVILFSSMPSITYDEMNIKENKSFIDVDQYSIHYIIFLDIKSQKLQFNSLIFFLELT